MYRRSSVQQTTRYGPGTGPGSRMGWMARKGLANIPGMARVPVVAEEAVEDVAEEVVGDVEGIALEDENKPAAAGPVTAGGARHYYKGKYYKVRIGKRGGKYIVVGVDKKKVYV